MTKSGRYLRSNFLARLFFAASILMTGSSVSFADPNVHGGQAGTTEVQSGFRFFGPSLKPQDFEKCRKFGASAGLAENSIGPFCQDFSNVETIAKPEFDSCILDLTNLSNNQYHLPICLQVSEKKSLLKDQAKSACFSAALAATDIHFFFYEAMAKDRRWDNRVERIQDECSKWFMSDDDVLGKPYIANQFYFHSNTRRHDNRKLQLGGLSGLWYDSQKKRFFSVSDDETNPFIVEFEWNVATDGANPKMLLEKAIRDPKFDKLAQAGFGKKFDFEEIVKLPNGHFLLSSEVRDLEMVERQRSDENFGSDLNSYSGSGNQVRLFARPIQEVDSEGVLVREIPVAEELLPSFKKEERSYDCGGSYQNETDHSAPLEDRGSRRNQEQKNPTGSSGGSIFDLLFGRKSEVKAPPVKEGGTVTTVVSIPSKSNGRQPNIGKSTCRETYSTQAKGFRSNLGIEAMAYDVSRKEVIYGTEAPLEQDQPGFFGGSNSFLRIYVQTLDRAADSSKYYKYPISTHLDNGMSAIVRLPSGKILVLERAYDSSERQAIVKIYKVDLNKIDSKGSLVKELLVDVNKLSHQLIPGFQKLDNFEGMALVEDQEKGPFLVLISDNNYSSKQVTALLSIKVPRESLQ